MAEKEIGQTKAALLNLSFSRAALLALRNHSLVCRVDANSINPVSRGRLAGQKPSIHAGLQPFDGYSHSLLSGLI